MAQSFPHYLLSSVLKLVVSCMLLGFLAISDLKTMFLHLCCLGHKVDPSRSPCTVSHGKKLTYFWTVT